MHKLSAAVKYFIITYLFIGSAFGFYGLIVKHGLVKFLYNPFVIYDEGAFMDTFLWPLKFIRVESRQEDNSKWWVADFANKRCVTFTKQGIKDIEKRLHELSPQEANSMFVGELIEMIEGGGMRVFIDEKGDGLMLFSYEEVCLVAISLVKKQ